MPQFAISRVRTDPRPPEAGRRGLDPVPLLLSAVRLFVVVPLPRYVCHVTFDLRCRPVSRKVPSFDGVRFGVGSFDFLLPQFRCHLMHPPCRDAAIRGVPIHFFPYSSSEVSSPFLTIRYVATTSARFLMAYATEAEMPTVAIAHAMSMLAAAHVICMLRLQLWCMNCFSY